MHRFFVVVVPFLLPLACVTADERGCVKQSVAQCEQRFACLRTDGGASEFGYEVGASRTFVSCEVDAESCETRALERCTRP